MDNKYRIENIQKAYMPNHVKRFKVYEFDSYSKAYVFIGYFTAPPHTKNSDLVNYIDH